MLTDTLQAMLERELTTLREEILAYPDEADLWAVAPGISNSAGTLALHLVGNLRHYLGATLGGTGYVRDRDAEFSRRGVPREELVRSIEQAVAEVRQALARVRPEELETEYPLELRGSRPTVEFLLLHTLAHFNYHLGQVNYHRRLLAGRS
jgi:uncharacterized damage-inducible protein DinB